MKFLRTVIPVIIVLVLIFGASCTPINASSTKLGTVTDYRSYVQQPLAQNGSAPDFQFQMPDGETMFLSDLKGKTVLLNFWAVSCPYCVKEMPYLQQAYDSLSSQGVIILGVNTGESAKTVAKFVSSKKLSFPVLLDPEYYASILYNAQYLPTTYLIDKAGNINNVKIGAFSDAEQIITSLEELVQ
jgi:peroxiredoxin